MNKIQKRAKELRDAANKLENEAQKLQDQEVKLKKQFLINEFNVAFKEVIPDLKELGVVITDHYNDERYFHLGTYIKLSHKGKSCNMDFSHANSYRLEHVPKGTGSMTYGKWSVDKFILFLDENLFSS